LLGASSSAQQPKVLAPHRPVAPRSPKPKSWNKPAILQSVVGGLWMIDANFKSSIYLKNDVMTDPLTVSPILYLSNGVKYSLPDVKLDPSGTAVVNVNQALADFVAPKSTGMLDYVGAFVVTAGRGLDQLCAKFEKDHDDYNSIMAKALADRRAKPSSRIR